MDRLFVLVVATCALAACGSPGRGVAPGGAPATSPDVTVSATSASGSGPAGPRYALVEPRPGMAGVHPIGFERVRPLSGGTTLRVIFWSGVEPCSVLDSVEVEESDEEVTITLYEGHDPNATDVACIEIAMKKAVDVELSRPLGDRAVVDGAERA